MKESDKIKTRCETIRKARHPEMVSLETASKEGFDESFESLYQGGEIPEKEIQLHSELCGLSEEWRKSVMQNKSFASFSADFNMDGFYPYYTCQECKILFVGREACWLNGGNYIETVCKSIQADNFNGWTVNQYPFHKRQFYIAYGIQKFVRDGVFPKWEDVPWASDMAKRIFAKSDTESGVGDDFGGLCSISWAFINLSKLSNNSGNWQIGDTYYKFVDDEENQRFTREEIMKLDPDIIIGANVSELADILGYEESDKSNKNCHYYLLKDGFPHFLNCWHFSAIKPDKTAFYNPLAKIVQKHCKL